MPRNKISGEHGKNYYYIFFFFAILFKVNLLYDSFMNMESNDSSLLPQSS